MATTGRGNFPNHGSRISRQGLLDLGGFGDRDRAAGTVAADWFFEGSTAATLTGTGAGTMPALTGTGTGAIVALRTGTGAGTLPALTGAGVAALVRTGTGVGALGALTGSGTGTAAPAPATITGTGAGVLAALTGYGLSVGPSAESHGQPYEPPTRDVRIILGRGRGTFPRLRGRCAGNVEAWEMPDEVMLEAA